MDPNTLAGLILSKWVEEQIFGKKKQPEGCGCMGCGCLTVIIFVIPPILLWWA